jgi:hypothetical protein
VVLVSFLSGLALVVAATAFVVVRGVGLWRQLKRTGGALTTEVSLFDDRAARTERLLAEADRSNRELQAALERLRLSRAHLQVLLEALERARARVRWLRLFLPVP